MTEINIDFRFIKFPYEMWGLKDYLKALEESLYYHQQQYPKRIKTKLEEEGYEYNDPEFDFAFQKIDAIVEDIFPRTFRNSFIVVLWATFESTINEVANYLYKNTETKLKASDIRGSFIDRIEKYFDYVVNVPLNLSQEARQKLKILYTLRNAIVHGNGILENLEQKTQSKLREWEKQFEGFEIKSMGEIILKKDYLEESYDLVSEIASELIKKVKQEIN